LGSCAVTAEQLIGVKVVHDFYSESKEIMGKNEGMPFHFLA